MIVPLAKTSPLVEALIDDTAVVEEAIAKRRQHPYERYAADPRKAAPRLHGADLHRLTGAGYRRSMANGNARPAVLRPGSTDHLQWPSRAGNRLRWPDGRLTDLDGVTPIEP